MSRADIDFAVDWAADEGWNPGHHDADAFYAVDERGFLVGELRDEPVACISVVAYDESFGFLGFYIVRPEHRGRGYGLQMWNAGMEYLCERNVGLDGVVAQQDNYRKSGFRYAYANQRFETLGGGTRPEGVVPAADVSFEDMLAYDSTCFPVPRPIFLRHWLSMPTSTALAVTGDGGVRGYGVIRACRRGHKIGPLFADTHEIAETLYRALASEVPGEPVFLDVPMPNPAAVALAGGYGMKPVFETARMYTGAIPAAPLERIFGVTTFELG